MIQVLFPLFSFVFSPYKVNFFSNLKSLSSVPMDLRAELTAARARFIIQTACQSFRRSSLVAQYTVKPRYNEVLGTMKITLLYQVSHYIRVKKQRNIKSWDQQNDLVLRGFCYNRPRYIEVPLYYAILPHRSKCVQTVL